MAGSRNMSGRGPRDVNETSCRKTRTSLLKGLSVEFQNCQRFFENLERKELHKSVLELKGNLIED